MAVQLQKVIDNEFINPVTAEVVDPQPLLDIFQCRNCFVRDDCFIEQVIKASAQPDIERKNKQLFLKDEHIFHECDVSESIYVIHSGSVKSYVITEEGEEQVLGFYFAGDVLGLDALDGNVHLVTADALEMTSICQLSLSQFQTQDLIPRFFHLALAQQTRSYDLVLMLASKNADGRMASFLVSLSKQFQACGYSASEFNLSMCRYDIASYLGLTVETVSRTFRRFRDNGLLEITRRKVKILDIENLRLIAGRLVSS